MTLEVTNPPKSEGSRNAGDSDDTANPPAAEGGAPPFPCDGGGSQGVHYNPQPHEKHYYESLYKVASKTKALLPPPTIPFATASHFFSLSRLPISRLRIIWKIADQTNSQTLTPLQFNVAVRLIQLHQNGQRVRDMALNPQDANAVMKPAYFEGISAVKVPLPRPPGNSALKREGSDRSHVSELTMDNFGESSSSSFDLFTLPNRPSSGGTGKKTNDVVMAGARNAAQVHSQAGEWKSSQKSPVATKNNNNDKPSNKPVNCPPCVLSASMTAALAPVPESMQHVPDGQKDIAMCPYAMTAAEMSMYRAAFMQHKEVTPSDCDDISKTAEGWGHVNVPTAVKLFAQSGLNHNQVGSIWNLVLEDPTEDRLNNIEFVMMMHIVECVTKKGLVVPATLPESLRRWKEGLKRAKDSMAVQRSEKGSVKAEVGPCPYSMTAEEAESYVEMFVRHRVASTRGHPLPSTAVNGQDPSAKTLMNDGGHIYAPAAFKLFTKAGLSDKQIGSVWDIVVDNPNAGRLEKIEFVLMMHLAVCISQRALALPERLPFSLKRWKAGSTSVISDAESAIAAPPTPGSDPSKVRPCCVSCNSLSKRCTDLGVEVWSMRNELEQCQNALRRMKKEMAAMRKDLARSNTISESAARGLKQLECKIDKARSRPSAARQLSSKSLHKQLSSRCFGTRGGGSLPHHSRQSSRRLVSKNVGWSDRSLSGENSGRRASRDGSQSRVRSDRSFHRHTSEQSIDIDDAVLERAAAAFGGGSESDRHRSSSKLNGSIPSLEASHNKTSDSEKNNSSSEWVGNPFRIVRNRRIKSQQQRELLDRGSRTRRELGRSTASMHQKRGPTHDSNGELSYDSSSSLEPEIMEIRRQQGVQLSVSSGGGSLVDNRGGLAADEEEHYSGDEVVMHPAYQRRGSLTAYGGNKRTILKGLKSEKREEVFVPHNWATNEERRSTSSKKGGVMSIFNFSTRETRA